jgi:enoyl-CoA hydratase/carnithine racemase
MAGVRYEKKADGVAVITLDRPDHANSLSYRVLEEELPAAWQAAGDDDEVRAIVFTAIGDRFFCAGVDLKDPEMASMSDREQPVKMRATGRQNDVWKPIITAVNIPFEAVMRMMVLGRAESIGAQRAFELGLVSQLTKPEALLETALSLGRTIAANPPALVQAAVKVLWRALELPLTEAVDSSLRAIAALREGTQPA